MVMLVAFGVFTWVVVVGVWVSILFRLSVPQPIIFTIMGVGLIGIVLGATGALIRSRKNNERTGGQMSEDSEEMGKW